MHNDFTIWLINNYNCIGDKMKIYNNIDIKNNFDALLENMDITALENYKNILKETDEDYKLIEKIIKNKKDKKKDNKVIEMNDMLFSNKKYD